jgi:hypothetical protein
MLMATPLEMRALITILADSSRPGLISPARSAIIWAVMAERAEAYSLNSSFRILWASCQSSMAVKLEMISPHPAAKSRAGAWEMILLSATMARGD